MVQDITLFSNLSLDTHITHDETGAPYNSLGCQPSYGHRLPYTLYQ